MSTDFSFGYTLHKVRRPEAHCPSGGELVPYVRVSCPEIPLNYLRVLTRRRRVIFVRKSRARTFERIREQSSSIAHSQG